MGPCQSAFFKKLANSNIMFGKSKIIEIDADDNESNNQIIFNSANFQN
jgi:hypothetical protein